MARKPTALVIDDDEFYRSSVSDALKASGFACSTAANGADGYELYRKLIPDLVVLDRIMPQAGGTRFMMSVRDKPNSKEAVLVVYSSTLRAHEDSADGRGPSLGGGFSRIIEAPKSTLPVDLAARLKDLFFSAKA